jgi:hypothetical protein
MVIFAGMSGPSSGYQGTPGVGGTTGAVAGGPAHAAAAANPSARTADKREHFMDEGYLLALV